MVDLQTIRTGDVVADTITGERWVVAFAYPEDDAITWCGWPPGRAHDATARLTLVTAATDAKHLEMLELLAASQSHRSAPDAKRALDALLGAEGR